MSIENNVENRAYKVYMTLKDKKPFAYQIGDKLYYIGLQYVGSVPPKKKVYTKSIEKSLKIYA